MNNLALFAEQDSAHDGVTVAGVAVRQDAHGRFCLNDLHKAAGGEKRHQPSDWAELLQTKELIAEISNSGDSRNCPIESNVGRYGGTYVCKELVYAYAMWISASFHLKVIRAYDGMTQAKRTAPATPAPSTPLAQDLEALQVLASWLNVAPSGQIGMARVAVAHHAPHLLPALPSYAIDAPKHSATVAGSSDPTFSATHLLKEFDVDMTAAKFNAMLHDAGIIERRARKSSIQNVTKTFWSVTDKGLPFGKNVSSDKNPRETQPHWYASKFAELLDLVRSQY